ncbi:hypothetical protein AJ79_02755 [Helicocarpus griseus UAMH5409]|uniref:Uncharacterized protein n=1 Tax=Helicocarpus griseus UAMH5409 TaxID=1447875 RepID=A0A2B7Y211_9EURO|nr:hypothetical protein AJ79_02755 [Helicocarpus griseus UAMH5409]
MATRRSTASPTAKGEDVSPLTGQPEKPTQIPPGTTNGESSIPSDVILKLLFFTAAMICAPLGVYYASVNALFKGNATYAGATAAVTANLVLIGYVIVAMREDSGEEEKERWEREKGKGKKAE